MEKPQCQIIVIGCGKWGTNLIINAHTLGHLIAIVDPSPQSITQLHKQHPTLSTIPFYPTLCEALTAHRAATAAVIATPPSTHFTAASEALQAGLHVFVEKPMCSSVRDADTLTRLAESKGLKLMVDHLLQYSEGHRRLVTLVGRGVVGKVRRVRMSRLNFGTVRVGENVLWSFCPHDVSILLSIVAGGGGGGNGAMDDVVNGASVVATGQAVVSEGVEDYVDVSVKFKNGIVGQIEASWLHPFKERRVIVYGSEGFVVLNEAMPDERMAKLQVFKWSAKRTRDGKAVASRMEGIDVANGIEDGDGDGDGNGNELDFTSDEKPLRAALEHFVHCVREGVAPRTDGVEGVGVLSLLEAASTSIDRNGEAVCVGRMCGDGGDGGNDGNGGNSGNSGIVHPSAIVDEGAVVGTGTRIWHFSHVMAGAVIGAHCNIGQNVFVANTATIGNKCKIQNNVSIYDGVTLSDNVFLGPSCVFTNVKTPRAHISRRNAFEQTAVGRGVTVGANATIVCGVQLGDFAFVGAGAVVTKDVMAHAMVYGNPAGVRGWVSTVGVKLERGESLLGGGVRMTCPQSGEVYVLYEGGAGADSRPKLERIDKPS